ncbi:DUF420 domain-containing protein [Halocalculus aciditolerans]|uniref:DUF420 domain-containing protein n=1 Tax=Halocalculus aciditolerans TaxID=1383812 RepID=A0A830FGI3_9EURY|nr:DUF420 domain-containing protein [Halocalculus aciditolerans]GGL53394.1 hypothetical protein GCM10009039_09470 [Halocalculus aciditolerans]
MRTFVRQHVPATTAVVSALALAAVFAAVGGVIPPRAVPHHPFVALAPHANAVVSVTAVATILAGVRWARRKEFGKHRVAMLASTLLFVAFLTLYLWHIILEGTTAFGGPDSVYTFVYLPLLAVHILLAIVCIPVVFYALILAGTHSVAELAETHHARAGRIAASLWVVSFTLGTVVYVLLHHAYA